MNDITISTSAVPDSGSASSASPAPSTPATPPSDTGAGAAGTSAPSADTARPLSFADALARAEQAHTAAPPPTETPAAAATPGEAPIAPPDSPEELAADPNAPPAPEQRGPIPFERHKAALENARQKAREEIAAQVRTEYGEHIRLGEAFRANPVEAAITVLQELQQNPAYAPQLTSLAARMLAQRRGQNQAESAMPEPDLTGVDGNGQQVRFYSADQQAKRDAWLAQRLLSQVRQEVQPLQQAHQQTVAEQQRQAQQQQTVAAASKLIQTWSSQPGFAENKDAIRQAQAKFYAEGYDSQTALGLAYAQVVTPWMRAQQQNQMVASAAQKAAGTTANPAAVTPTPRSRPRSFAEALERAAGVRS